MTFVLCESSYDALYVSFVQLNMDTFKWLLFVNLNMNKTYLCAAKYGHGSHLNGLSCVRPHMRH